MRWTDGSVSASDWAPESDSTRWRQSVLGPVRFQAATEEGVIVKKKHTTPSTFAKFVAVLGLAALAPSIASAAPLTYCQENGHGANGCSDLLTGGGYCWENTSSPSGYVCREEKPASDDSVISNDEVVASQDPIYDVNATVEGDPDDIQPLEIVICGPEGGAGCFWFAIPNVCCDDVGLPYGEATPMGAGTITCYD